LGGFAAGDLVMFQQMGHRRLVESMSTQREWEARRTDHGHDAAENQEPSAL
jgi:hypothetical protein